MGWLDRRRVRLPLALVAAVVVAEVAVFLLAPRTDVLEPAAVAVGSYFSDAYVDRAEAFRAGQFVLLLAAMAVELAVLVALVVRPPGVLRRSWRRPVLTAAGAAAALSLLLAVAPLPFQAVARQRAIDVGLITQGWAAWAGDLALSWTIGAVTAAAGGAVAIALMRRWPRRWWLPGAAVVVGFGALTVYAGPLVLDPLFNDFRRLPPGELREDVLELARRAGVDVERVLVMDASRRTTAANAYVTGLGNTKRIVLYDNLLRDFRPDEVRLVVAHELGHVAHRDLLRGLLWLALVAPAGVLAVAVITGGLGPPGRAGPRTVPALALALAIVVPVVTAVSTQLSRRVEASADVFSLRLTGDVPSFIRFEQRIAVQNVADPDPPWPVTKLLRTHPPTIERIGLGVRYALLLRDVDALRQGGDAGPLRPAPRQQPQGIALVGTQRRLGDELLGALQPRARPQLGPHLVSHAPERPPRVHGLHAFSTCTPRQGRRTTC